MELSKLRRFFCGSVYIIKVKRTPYDSKVFLQSVGYKYIIIYFISCIYL